MNPKQGDWLFFEFNLGYVKEDRGDGRLSIGDGSAETSGSLADRCFPLDYRILQISDAFEWCYRELHKDTDGFNLNWPDIHNWFVDQWVAACKVKDDDSKTAAYLDAMNKFCREIREGCKDMRFKTVAGVQAFARR